MNQGFNKKIIAIIFLCTFLASINACATPPQASNDKLYSVFIDNMVKQHQFKKDELTLLLNDAKLQPRILKAMASPAEKRLEWHSYRKIFLKPNRIQGGIKFWNENKSLLQAASEKYGVPAEIIVAIIGVETRYGNNTGSFRVLDALTTLGFHYPKRAKFFQRELEQFLLLCREENFDPKEPLGSYAGAMGQSQFIASSYRAYAVDGDGNKQRDLWQSPADIINSIANYFAQHGWKNGQLITQKAQLTGISHKTLLNTALKPKHTLKELSQHQIDIPTELPSNTLVKLLELKQVDHSDFWLTYQNFYVITRYNHSALYAMAVYQLSEEIKKGQLAQ